jgi:hypothetical protein
MQVLVEDGLELALEARLVFAPLLPNG